MTDSETVMTLLRKVPLFANLRDEDKVFIEETEEWRLPAGEMLVEEGEHAEYFWSRDTWSNSSDERLRDCPEALSSRCIESDLRVPNWHYVVTRVSVCIAVNAHSPAYKQGQARLLLKKAKVLGYPSTSGVRRQDELSLRASLPILVYLPDFLPTLETVKRSCVPLQLPIGRRPPTPGAARPVLQ